MRCDDRWQDKADDLMAGESFASIATARVKYSSCCEGLLLAGLARAATMSATVAGRICKQLRATRTNDLLRRETINVTLASRLHILDTLAATFNLTKPITEDSDLFHDAGDAYFQEPQAAARRLRRPGRYST